MKKVFALFMVVAVIAAMMLTVTACGTKNHENEQIETGLNAGLEDGEIKWSRFHHYGTNDYDQAIEWREYRKAQGDVVSEITWDSGRGMRTYWFTAGHIAE